MFYPLQCVLTFMITNCISDNTLPSFCLCPHTHTHTHTHTQTHTYTHTNLLVLREASTVMHSWGCFHSSYPLPSCFTSILPPFPLNFAKKLCYYFLLPHHFYILHCVNKLSIFDSEKEVIFFTRLKGMKNCLEVIGYFW